MNNRTENKLDELLDTMKNRTLPEKDLASTEKFKADFFQKVNNTKAHSRRRMLKIFLPAAAGILLCAGIIFLNFRAELSPRSLRHKSRQVKIRRVKPAAKTAVSAVNRAKKETAPAAKALNEEIPQVEYAVPPPAVSMAPVLALRCSTARCEKKAKLLAAAFDGATVSDSMMLPPPRYKFDTREYKGVKERSFTAVTAAPLSTFGADVDTASYTTVREFLQNSGSPPPPEAIRIEEFINYFEYDYKAPQNGRDFQVQFESMDAPWAEERKLLLVGIQAKKVDVAKLPPSNFVFLIDNSGSMYDVFPMVIEAMETLAGKLRENDRISIVTYGGGVKVLLDGGSGIDREKVKKQIRSLQAGGYTPGGSGILSAYKLAHKHFIKGGNNRIVLITDGDFNVGASSEAALVKMVEKERRNAIYLSVFGVGMDNYKDNKLKMLANRGNGNYFYLDNIREARRVMQNELTGNMFTLARDVKFQLEFNPARVAAYRLIGYELRALAARDFNDDSKDSGEVGVGHQVTAIYELIMADAPAKVREKYLGNVDKLKYQQPGKNVGSGDLLTFKLRYQQPEGKAPSSLLTFELRELPAATTNIRWAAAVTEFALILRNSEFKGSADLKTLRARAQKLLGADASGKRAEFLTLIKMLEER